MIKVSKHLPQTSPGTFHNFNFFGYDLLFLSHAERG